jgi:hypothetical protein
LPRNSFSIYDIQAVFASSIQMFCRIQGETSRASIITGSGGSGKSMMMRHLLVSALQAGEKTPVFLELRSLNKNPDSFETAILGTLKVGGLEVDERFLGVALRAGQFYFLLDGFDEVERATRDRVANQIRTLAEQYPLNRFTVSSRPDTALEDWQGFTTYSLDPLVLDSAVELVSKVPYDEAIKGRFIDAMRRDLFETHRSFLSNPLLLSIMLLTYSDVAHIPQKLSTFYAQAFEALFHRHDALKSGYERERRSGLDIQDFGRAFSAFSVLSYDRREFSFTRTRAIEVVDAARDAAMLRFDSNAFLDDAIQAVCLLVEEGLEVAFAHRSFQEYFVARFIHASPPDVKPKLVERFVPSAESDAVLRLLHEIDPYIVESYYILPALAQLREVMALKGRLGITHYLRWFRAVYEDIHVRTDMEHSVAARVKNWPLVAALDFAFRRYRDWNDFREAMAPQPKERLFQLFQAEFGNVDSVPTSRLRTSSPFVRAIAERSGFWSSAFIAALLEIESEIKLRHKENRESLEHLLLSRREFSFGEIS